MTQDLRKLIEEAQAGTSKEPDGWEMVERLASALESVLERLDIADDLMRDFVDNYDCDFGAWNRHEVHQCRKCKAREWRLAKDKR